MRKMLWLFIAVIFLSGCALTTIKPYKKQAMLKPEPREKSIKQPIFQTPTQPAPIKPEEEEIK